MKRIHDARLAGRWYAGDAAELRRDIEAKLAAAVVPPDLVPTALVVPHAGYMYSGRTAAYAYAAAARCRVQRVAILAPSHYGFFHGVRTLLWEGFRTPLGIVDIDREAVEAYLDVSWVREDATPFGHEHSLEIHLPFLQVVLPGVPVVPLLVGEVPLPRAQTWGAELARLWDTDTLVLVSSDLTHYGARFEYLPFPPDSAEFVRHRLQVLDGEAIARICAGDVHAFTKFVEATQATICGRYPIVLFLGGHTRRSEGMLLSYSTSLDVTGDYEHVVSYAAIAFAPPSARP